MTIKINSMSMTLDDCIRYGLIDEELAQAIEDHIKEEAESAKEVHDDCIDQAKTLIEELIELHDYMTDRLNQIIEDAKSGDTELRSIDVASDHAKACLEDIESASDKMDSFKELWIGDDEEKSDGL